MITKRFILFTILLPAIICGSAKHAKTQTYVTKDGVDFISVDISDNLRILMPPDIEQKYRAQGAADFIEVMNKNIDAVLPIKIDYPQKLVFTFMVLPRGEEFKRISGTPFDQGMAGARCCPGVLVIDEPWFFKFSNMKGDIDIGLIHELSHTMHGMFFRMLAMSEGFAEIIPFYILGLEDAAQKEIIKNMKPGDIYTVASVDKDGMFQDAEEMARPGRMPAQYRKSYISMYLWIRGYLKELEKQRNIDKVEALNILLSEFQKAANYGSLKERNYHIAVLIGLPPDTLFNTVTLQLEAQKDLLR